MSAGRAIAWEFGWRHRIWLVSVAAYLVVFCAVKLFILGPGRPIKLDPPNGLAGFLIGPTSWIFFFSVGVFSYGLSGDLAARQSIFPARMFALPISNRALAGWPMLYGTLAAATLWWVTAALARWPGGIDIDVPWVWPALLAASYLAWTQALMWTPYGLPGARVVVAALWLMAVDIIVLLALNYKARELTMVAILAPQIPLAYFVAWHSVARARRGDVPDWNPRGRFLPVPLVPPVLPLPPFSSPSRAQLWFEWRQHGLVLPAMTALVVPVELMLLFIPGNGTAPVVLTTLFVVCITLPFLAIFAAAAVSASNTFMATRPMTTAALVAAKIRMSVWSTLAAWLLVFVLIPIALQLSGTMPVLVERMQAGLQVAGPLRFSAAAAFLFAALFAATWKRLVQSLCIGLTGRGWVIKSTIVFALAFLAAIGPIFDWIRSDTNLQSFIWNGLPWILVSLVFAKACAAAWVAIRLNDSRLLSDRALVTGAVCWLATVTAIYGLLVWFADSLAFARYFLAAVSVLNVPLARISAAPLALAWNRHR